MSPIRQASPTPTATGGTLARVPFTGVPRAGLSYNPLRASSGAPCRVLLSRNAPSLRGLGCGVLKGANGAAGMRKGRKHRNPLARGFRHFSLSFHEAAHKFRTHHTDTNQALSSLGLGRGAAGRVQRHFPPRLSIPSQIDDFTHGHSNRFRSRKRKPSGSAFACAQNVLDEKC